MLVIVANNSWQCYPVLTYILFCSDSLLTQIYMFFYKLSRHTVDIFAILINEYLIIHKTHCKLCIRITIFHFSVGLMNILNVDFKQGCIFFSSFLTINICVMTRKSDVIIYLLRIITYYCDSMYKILLVLCWQRISREQNHHKRFYADER